MTVTALASGVLSAITTSLIASSIVWCVVLKKRQKKRDTFPGVQQQQETPSAELVVYDVPVFDKQDNKANDGNIALHENVAYEQIKT